MEELIDMGKVDLMQEKNYLEQQELFNERL